MTYIMPKNKKDKSPKSLSPEGIAVMRNANNGVVFDSIDVKDVIKKSNIANISSQNADTGIPSYNPGDTRPYEQKNTSAGFHKSGMGSK